MMFTNLRAQFFLCQQLLYQTPLLAVTICWRGSTEIPFLFYSGEPGCRAQHSFSDAVEASSAGARLDKERCVEIGFHVMKGKRFRGIHGS